MSYVLCRTCLLTFAQIGRKLWFLRGKRGQGVTARCHSMVSQHGVIRRWVKSPSSKHLVIRRKSMSWQNAYKNRVHVRRFWLIVTNCTFNAHLTQNIVRITAQKTMRSDSYENLHLCCANVLTWWPVKTNFINHNAKESCETHNWYIIHEPYPMLCHLAEKISLMRLFCMSFHSFPLLLHSTHEVMSNCFIHCPQNHNWYI